MPYISYNSQKGSTQLCIPRCRPADTEASTSQLFMADESPRQNNVPSSDAHNTFPSLYVAKRPSSVLSEQEYSESRNFKVRVSCPDRGAGQLMVEDDAALCAAESMTQLSSVLASRDLASPVKCSSVTMGTAAGFRMSGSTVHHYPAKEMRATERPVVVSQSAHFYQTASRVPFTNNDFRQNCAVTFSTQTLVASRTVQHTGILPFSPSTAYTYRSIPPARLHDHLETTATSGPHHPKSEARNDCLHAYPRMLAGKGTENVVFEPSENVMQDSNWDATDTKCGTNFPGAASGHGMKDLGIVDGAVMNSLPWMLPPRNENWFPLREELKNVKAYMITGWVSRPYLEALMTRTVSVNAMFDNALDEVGDIRSEILQYCNKTSSAILARDLVFRVFSLGELNGIELQRLSKNKMGAIRRCVRRQFPRMEKNEWTSRCIPMIRASVKMLFNIRVKELQELWADNNSF